MEICPGFQYQKENYNFSNVKVGNGKRYACLDFFHPHLQYARMAYKTTRVSHCRRCGGCIRVQLRALEFSLSNCYRTHIYDNIKTRYTIIFLPSNPEGFYLSEIRNRGGGYPRNI